MLTLTCLVVFVTLVYLAADMLSEAVGVERACKRHRAEMAAVRRR